MKKINFKLKNTQSATFNKPFLNFITNKKIWPSNLFFEQFVDTTISKASSSRSFDRWVCLNIPAAEATMQPPVGPFLGQHGFNTNLFCKAFNDLTQSFPKSLPLRVTLKLFTDKTFLFKIKLPSTSYLIYSFIKTSLNNFLTPLEILKISFIKKIDFPKYKIISLTAMILGTLWSMKIPIKKK